MTSSKLVASLRFVDPNWVNPFRTSQRSDIVADVGTQYDSPSPGKYCP